MILVTWLLTFFFFFRHGTLKPVKEGILDKIIDHVIETKITRTPGNHLRMATWEEDQDNLDNLLKQPNVHFLHLHQLTRNLEGLIKILLNKFVLNNYDNYNNEILFLNRVIQLNPRNSVMHRWHKWHNRNPNPHHRN